MAIVVTHPFVSPRADGADATQVQPSNWNADHTVNIEDPLLIGDSPGIGVPGANNPWTVPSLLSVVDGTQASPQTDCTGPAVAIQRINNDPAHHGHGLVVHVASDVNASTNQGAISLSSVVSDMTVARGGTASRATAYAFVNPSTTALVSATIVGTDIIIITSTPHYIKLGDGVTIIGSTGITGLNSEFHAATSIDSATQFKVAKGGLTGGPASGGSVIAHTAYYSRWSSTWKLVGHVRMVGEESDMNNLYGDAGNNTSTIDATFNYAVYSSGNNNTTGIYIDSGDGVGKFYFPLKFGVNAVVEGYPYIDTTRNNGTYPADFAWIGNNQFLRWGETGVQGNDVAGKWPILGVDNANVTRISSPTTTGILIGPNLGSQLVVTGTGVSHRVATTQVKTANYIASETGSNNAIAGALIDAALGVVPLAAGLEVVVKLAHTLQAGANTFDFNGGGAVVIKSSRNAANNIGVAYAATGVIKLLYDGTQWLDMNQ